MADETSETRSILIDPFCSIWDNPGVEMATTVEFFQAGTSTPQVTFTDAGGLTPNDNPFILTNGRGTAYGTDGQGYKIVLKDKNENILKTEDNYYTPLGSDKSRIIQQIIMSDSPGTDHTTLIPYDSTLPQNTEGEEILFVLITPQRASSILLIESIVYARHDVVGARITTALFQDLDPDAISCAPIESNSVGELLIIPLRHRMVADTTSEIEFDLRIGANVAGNTRVIDDLGGTVQSSLMVTEMTL